jgi:hypothetical protein
LLFPCLLFPCLLQRRSDARLLLKSSATLRTQQRRLRLVAHISNQCRSTHRHFSSPIVELFPAAAEAKRRKALTKEQRDAEDAAKKAAEEAAKASEDAVVLVEQEVVLRGNGSTAMEGTKVRTCAVSCWLFVCA